MKKWRIIKLLDHECREEEKGKRVYRWESKRMDKMMLQIGGRVLYNPLDYGGIDNAQKWS